MGKTADSESARYDTEGKQTFRDLLFRVCEQAGIQSYGTLWGGGTDARMGVEHGLRVIAAEVDRSLHPALLEDARQHGYEAFPRRAGKLVDHVDMFHADFCGNASPSAFRELGRIATITNAWLAVTLSPDHQLNPAMQGEAAAFTIPAWLTGATGFTLEYLSRYQRNTYGQTMWTALLQRRNGRGNSHRVQPLQIAYSIERRGYWASAALYEQRVLPHLQAPMSGQGRKRQAEYELENQVARAESRRKAYYANRDIHLTRMHDWQQANPDKVRSSHQKYHQKMQSDPEYRAKNRAGSLRWYEANREKAKAQARESRLRKKEASAGRALPAEAHVVPSPWD